MKDSTKIHLLIVYAAIGIVTFGYTWNHDYVIQTGPMTNPVEVNTMRSVIAGMLWPLYWSVRVFEFVRP